MTNAQKLRAERDRLQLTRLECAALLDVSPAWVDKAESNRRSPLAITFEGALARLAKIPTPKPERK
jgi:transcriptional regulator with XRE-family HTH domain